MANYTPTYPKNVRLVPVPSAEQVWGFTHKARINYADIANASATANSDTITVTLGTTPANFIVDSCFANVVSAFNSNANATQTITATFGTSATANAFIAATSVKTAGPIIAGTGGPFSVANTTASMGVTANTLQVVFTNGAAGNPATLSNGALDVFVSLIDLDKVGAKVTG